MNKKNWSRLEELIKQFTEEMRTFGILNLYLDEMGGGRIQLEEKNEMKRYKVISFYINSEGDFEKKELLPPSLHNGAW